MRVFRETGMMTYHIVVFHNIGRGLFHGHKPDDNMVPVFMYLAVGGDDSQVFNDAWYMFNEATDGLGDEYRARRLRSLSVGDVVSVDGRNYAVESVGTRRIDCMNVLLGDSADAAIRKRYRLPAGEPLSITVPLPL
jgi:hypothetical protein